MKYGSNIKNAREKLNLYQKDIASFNLSRNFISNIESGKSRLTPSKALMIFKKIIEFSVKKSKYLEIEFNDLLLENEEYINLRDGYSICKKLNDFLESNTKLNKNDLNEYIEFADKNDIGILRYYIYYYSASLLDIENEYKLQIYFKALDYLKWTKMEFVLELYKKCLSDLVKLAYKYSKFDLLIHYYEILLNGEEQFRFKVDLKIYYNLALFYKYLEKYDLALKNLERYLENNDDMSMEHIINAMIVKATILTKTNKITEGFKIYEEILDKLKIDDLVYQRSLCLSNMIYNISINNFLDKKDDIVCYLDNLVEIFDQAMVFSDAKEIAYSNIGQGYFYLKDYEKSKEYFNKSLKCVFTDNKKVVILKESYKTYLMNAELHILIERVLEVNKSNLSFREICIFYKLLLKIQSNLILNGVEKKYENMLLKYISEL